MKSEINEYAPEARDGFGYHDGKQKVFELVRTTGPEDMETIFRARIDALEDPELTDGARMLFARLLDSALDPASWFKRRGQVCISNTQLRERLSRSARAIYGWTKELETQRHVWMSKLGRPTCNP